MKNSSIIFGVCLLASLSSLLAAADSAPPMPQATETWSYANCQNLDGVSAQPDQSQLWIRYGTGTAANRAVEIIWKTTLFSGDDEMSTGRGAMAKMVSDPNPVSPTWKFFVPEAREEVTKNSTLRWSWTAVAYPLTSEDAAFGSLPGLITFSESASGDPASRTIEVAQRYSANEYAVSRYFPNSMTRQTIKIDTQGQATMETDRACGQNAGTALSKAQPVFGVGSLSSLALGALQPPTAK